MRAHGSDKLRIDGKKSILLSRHPKNWTARVPKTLTHAEHPGTAVLWDDQFFEVVEVQQTPGGIRYVLEPWREEHAIRISDRYDDEAEAARAADRRHVAVRNNQRRATLLLSLFAGHLPAPVQEKLGNELGITPSRMTLASILPSIALIALCIFEAAQARIDQRSSSIPTLVGIFAAYMALDSTIRFFVAMSQSRPIGSFPGLVLYLIYYLLARDKTRLVHPIEGGRGDRLFTLPPEEHVALADEVEMRGALISLLSPDEQRRLASTVGYDYRRHAKGIAWIILGTGLLGVVSAIQTMRSAVTPGAVVSLILGGGLAIEQLARLIALQRGPVGSFLAPLARPFVRRLLERG